LTQLIINSYLILLLKAVGFIYPNNGWPSGNATVVEWLLQQCAWLVFIVIAVVVLGDKKFITSDDLKKMKRRKVQASKACTFRLEEGCRVTPRLLIKIFAIRLSYFTLICVYKVIFSASPSTTQRNPPC
jgi:hypothetical protein